MSRYGKRRREEPESDDDLDEEEREALRAFQEEGFNEDIVKKEADRKKKVEEDLDKKQKEAEEERKRRQAAAEKKQKQDEEARKRKEDLDLKLQELKGTLAGAASTVIPEPKNKVVETSAQEQLAEKHPNYKTRLCTRWQQGGCSFGSNCGFAHGTEDLRLRGPAPVAPGMVAPVNAMPGWMPGMPMQAVQQFPGGMQAMVPGGMSGGGMPGYGMPMPMQQPMMQMVQHAPSFQRPAAPTQLPPGYVAVPQYPGMMAPATGGSMVPIPGNGMQSDAGGAEPPPPPPPPDN